MNWLLKVLQRLVREKGPGRRDFRLAPAGPDKHALNGIV